MAEKKPPRWHAEVLDFGALSAPIEFDADTISDIAWHVYSAWGRWHRLPGTDGDVILSDALIVRVYDTTKKTEAPAWELTPSTKGDRIVRRRPPY